MKKITEYFNSNLIQKLKKKSDKSHKSHPLVYFNEIEKGNRNGEYDENINNQTKLAFNTLENNSIESKKFLDTRIYSIKSNDIPNAYSALAEIRVYADLIRSGFEPKHLEDGSKQTADFQIQIQDEIVNIEVHCKQLSGEESRALIEHDIWISEQVRKKKKSGVEFYEKVVKPFGGRDNETIAENVAQKIAQIKSKSKQGQSNAVNILWMDFIDPDMWSLDPCNCQPIFTSASMFFSGGVWAGFFGKKGMPLFNGTPIGIGSYSYTIQKMRFDGKFRDDDNIFNIAILSFLNEKIIFQNPWSNYKIKPYIIVNLLRIINMKFEDSWINWPKRFLRSKICMAFFKIRKLSG